MPKPMVIDISHHQVIPESLEAAAASGIVGVIHKLTEGWSYVDNKCASRLHLAYEAGLCWGLYHFIRPNNIEQQAEFFLQKAIPVCDHNTLYALDWEDKGVSLDDALLFLRIIKEETGRTPILYSGHVCKEALGGEACAELSQYPLWVCHYGVDEPVLPPGWDYYWLWQYTDQGHCPGINPPVDLNDYLGTADELRAEWRTSDDIVPFPPREKPAVKIVITTRGIDPKDIEVELIEDG